MTISFSTAEELDQQKNKIRTERKLRLTKDRKKTESSKNGDRNLAQTDGLKVAKINKRRNDAMFFDEDDNLIDLRRVTRMSDVVDEDML